VRQVRNTPNVASLDCVALRQCKWNGANGNKQKKIKRASDKMRLDGGINLLFHLVLSSMEPYGDPSVERDLAGTLISPPEN
jgi:hypothetical protein